MSDTTILLVRHADVHNPDNVFYGRLPRFRLSELGRRQAATLADFLAPEPVVAIYTSPMLRARQTANYIADRHPGVPVHINSNFIEIRSVYEGMPVAELRKRRFNYYEPAKDPSDETTAEIWKRMQRGIDQVRHSHAGQTCVCVSHGDPIKIAWLAFEGRPLTLNNIRSGSYPARASVLRLTWREGAIQPEIAYASPAGGDASA